MYVNKFISFALSALLECAGGVSYVFSLYSPDLKRSLNYSQVQIQAISNPFIFLVVLGIIPGIVYDSLQQHNRLGPRVILLVGGLLHALGYLGLWAAGSHTISQPPYWVVVGFGILAMNGATWTDVACISVTVRSFPRDRGTAIGILKSMMGLSASVFAILYTVTLRPHAISFMLVIVVALPVLCIISIPFFNAVPFRQKGELQTTGHFWSNSVRFTIAYSVIAALSILMLLVSLLDLSSSKGGRIGVILGMVLVACPLLFLWIGSGGYWARPVLEAESMQDPSDITDPLLVGTVPEQDELGDVSAEGKGSSQPDWPLELPPEKSLRSLNFWLLYFTFGVGSACGLIFLNNAGQLTQSLGGLPDSQDPLLALFSIFNCLGRLAFGCIPEYMLHHWGTPRSIFMVGVSTLTAAVTYLTSVADLRLLYLTAPIAGLAYGAHWSLVPALASEYFGLSNFGLNYCVLGTSITLVSFCTSNMLGGYVYQAIVEKHNDKHDVCIGRDCFGITLIVVASLEVGVIVASFILHKRTSYIYAQEHREIQKEAEIILRSPDTGHRLVRQRHAQI